VVFVTVGTTSFDKLVETVTSPTICKILQGHGYKKLVLQIGKGEFEPECCNQNGFIVEFYRYKDSIAQDIAKASLVISHAGSGSILESLQAKRPLVVVINEELMGNHQLELAHELAEYHHLIYANCRTLQGILQTLDVSALLPFPPGRPITFGSYLNSVMGVS
ncbi:predicted protein, partial [Nematostella vectensis]